MRTPWVDPYHVRVSFESDGHYVANCVLPESEQNDTHCVAFYYGSDVDVPEKTYALQDVLADGSGVGEIVLVWDVGTSNTGRIDAIRVNDDRLTFKFWPTWLRRSIGPVRFDLVPV